MEENPFKSGDLVQLKSGGPIMTVQATEKKKVYTIWFNEFIHKFTTDDDFSCDLLKLVTDVSKAEPK